MISRAVQFKLCNNIWTNWIKRMSCSNSQFNHDNYQRLKEGKVEFFLPKDVFYNPVQEFNRDMSVLILDTYFEHELWNRAKKANRVIKHPFKVLDALSASGLRCIRYEKELHNQHKIHKYVSNDYSETAVQMIKHNVDYHQLSDRIEITNLDATNLMYQNRGFDDRFICIDVDPFGCAGPFLDAAVQSILDGGLLMVTATDLAILCGNNAETCYAKYGSVSIRIDACHEMALRILLKSIESAANRYGRYIKPLISISVDFYIRIFVQVFTGPSEAKKGATNSAMIYNCVTCKTHYLQRMGRFESKNDQIKHSLATGPPVSPQCSYCDSKFHVAGPIWAGPIHDFEFVQMAQQQLNKSVNQSETDEGVKVESSFGTFKRMQGILTVISEELPDIPLFYTPGQFTHILKCVSPTFSTFRNGILNAGYRVSYSHTNPLSLKTDAPVDFLWDLLIYYCRQHSDKDKQAQDKQKSNGSNGEHKKEQELFYDRIYNKLMAKKINREINFEPHPDEVPQSKLDQLTRFQVNPTKFWGPKPRVKPITDNDEVVDKRLQNQGKRNRKQALQKQVEPTLV